MFKNVYPSLFVIAKHWEQLRSSWKKEQVNSGILVDEEEEQTTGAHANARYTAWEKLVTGKLHTVRSCLCAIREQAKLTRGDRIRIRGCFREWRRGLPGKGLEEASWGVNSVLYLS